MAQSARILPNYSYEDYLHWEGRWELIEGIPYAMSPMPSPNHQFIAGNINGEFRTAVKNAKCQCRVYQPIDVKITENTVLNPDVLIVCKEINKQYLDFPPSLVVEILSPSTHLKDKITKLDLYQGFGIKYYLIVDPKLKSITAYQLDSEGKYQSIELPEIFVLEDHCSISPDLSDIW